MASSAGTHSPSGTHFPPGSAEPGGLRRWAFAGYHWLLAAFVLAGCAQIFLAGLGVFSFGDHDESGGTSAFDAHRSLGWALGGVAIVIFVLALIARPGAAPVALSGVLVVQTTVLQSLLAGLADNAALYGGLHATDGLLILGIAGGLYAASRRRRA
jgi:Family of unknown function (DUF6220)